MSIAMFHTAAKAYIAMRNIVLREEETDESSDNIQ
ncbi:hypothetical protein C5S36_15585 [Candidatus Methanophagaceae archaeon]|nr:hypothetical protein C5S36_15585 [Methanophagales archaeon]